MRRIWTIGILLALFIFALMGIFIVYQSGFYKIRANVTSDISPENSYVFATPLEAQANGIEKIRVTTFVLNGQGLGVLGKNVTIGTNDKLLITSIQPTTDNLGKAIFDISTATAGQYYVEVLVEGLTLPQKVQLTFNH